ncbi:MAG: YraN family protein [Candidatus Kapaibacterium sp.]
MIDTGKTEVQSSRSKGSDNEGIAIEYLINKGYEIIKRNFKFGRTGEIDIIAKINDVLVFVEVKSRKSYEFGSPLESVPPSKRKSIYHAAQGYLYINKIINSECRFDFIGIDLRSSKPQISHIENAF